MIAMAQLARQRPDATEAFDNLLVGCQEWLWVHSPFVRHSRTDSQLAIVQRYAEHARMSHGESVGARLRLLKERSGRSLNDIAVDMGVPRSTIQYKFEEGYRSSAGQYLDLEDAIEIGKTLIGYGNPPITQDEIFALTALPEVGGAKVMPLSRDVSEVMAEIFAQVLSGRQKPNADAVAALAHIIEEMSVYFQHVPSARTDAAEARGALRLLAQRAGRQAPEPPPA